MNETYPRWFAIETHDGDGEATKTHQGDYWRVNVPSGGFDFFGSKEECEYAIKKYYEIDGRGQWKSGHPKGHCVAFGSLQYGSPPEEKRDEYYKNQISDI